MGYEGVFTEGGEQIKLFNNMTFLWEGGLGRGRGKATIDI
jgi:hypothetical protein